MANVTDEKMCCGCGACRAICPKQCIEMKEGTLGHLFARVREDFCIACGRCEEVCPMLKEREKSNFQKTAYAAYAKDSGVRYTGSSGGMFGTFAHKLLKQGFLVYGAAFDSDMKLKCTAAARKSEIAPLLKSKYLQSDIGNKYKEIEERLKSGTGVLFVSTPCQVAALKSYLKKEYENLITVDFFCHGVPSQRFFDQCIKIDSKRLKGNIKKYRFRTKMCRGGGNTTLFFSRT